MGHRVQAYQSYSTRSKFLTNRTAVVCKVDNNTDEVELIGIDNNASDNIVLKIPSFVTKIGYEPLKELSGRIKVIYTGEDISDMSGLFKNAINIESIDLREFNTSRVTKMNRMFFNCKGLVSLNMLSLDISNVTEMNEILAECINLERVYMPDSSAKKMRRMEDLFRDCRKLECVTSEIYDIPKNCIIDEHTKKLIHIK